MDDLKGCYPQIIITSDEFIPPEQQKEYIPVPDELKQKVEESSNFQEYHDALCEIRRWMKVNNQINTTLPKLPYKFTVPNALFMIRKEEDDISSESE